MLPSRLSFFRLMILLCLSAATVCAQQTGSSASYLLVLNKAESTMAVVDPVKLTVLTRIPTGEGPHEIITSKDGRLAFVTNYGAQQPGSSLSVIDLILKKEVRRVDLGALRRPHGIIEAGGKIWFTCEINRLVARYDPATDKVDWIMGTGQDGTHMLVVTADAKKIYTANIRSNTITSFDLSTPQTRITQIAVGNQPEAIDLSPDGKELWVGQNGDGKISIIDTATHAVKESFQIGQMPIRVKFTPDGRRVIVSDAKAGEMIVVDAASRKEIKRIQIGQTPVGILITPDGKRAFVATMQDGKVAAIDLEKLVVSARIEPGQGPDGLAWVGK